MRDPYDVLGVARSASEGDIKRAYRRLAKQHHPDQNKSDPKAKDRFAEVNSANEILGDSDKRKAFDRGEIDAEGKPRFKAHQGFSGGGPGAGFENFEFGAGPGGPFQRRGGGPDPFSDMFANAFGGGQGRGGRPKPGDDVEIEARITLEHISRGESLRVTLPSGKTLAAAIPAGVADGQKIRLKGQGSHSQTGGPPGDLLIAVKIAPHALFRPEGANLLLDLPLSIDEAVIGGPVRVPALNGAVDLNIPAGANNGQTLRLRGRGLPGKSGQGDLLVTLRIALPGDDAALRKYAESLRKSGSYNARGPEFGE